MKLFKRILTSLFPDEIINQAINPISMFISFISAKSFFSVVNRKIIENYKINLFDISLDSFDVKVGFGKSPNIKHKEIENYYSYWVVSNFNWYRFYSPWNIGSLLAIVASIYTKEVFKNYDSRYFVNFLLTVYFLTFVFASRIKVFPYTDFKENYSWFIDVFFQFYKMISSINGFKVKNSEFPDIKVKLLENIQIFFMLFYVYKSFNKVFCTWENFDSDYYNRLFEEDIKKWPMKNISLDYIKNYKKYSRSYNFSTTEKKLMSTILPADAIIKYIFDKDDIYKMIDFVSSNIYDQEKLDSYLSWFLKWDENLEEFIDYIFDYNYFKKNYFLWVKNFISWKYRMDTEYDVDVEEDLDELMSSIWQEKEIDEMKIPDKLKKESQATEKLINFYITFVWWFWVSRWDNMYLRLFRPQLFDLFDLDASNWKLKQDSLMFYGSLIYTYSKNAFYYKFAFDNVRAGKEKFTLPYKASLKQVNSNKFLIDLFEKHFITEFFQDINKKDIKLYIQNKNLLDLFKTKFQKQISNMVNGKDVWLVDKIYSDSLSFLNISISHNDLYKNLKSNDIANLKESIYTLDLWIYINFINELKSNWVNLSEKYSDSSIIWIFSFLRNTLFWFALYLKFLEKKERESWKDLNISALKKIYIMEILFLSEEYYYIAEKIIDDILIKYDDILSEWLNIDDNSSYLILAYDNWINFIFEKSSQQILSEVMWEDIIWLRWFFKNITYYNKKYLLPRD